MPLPTERLLPCVAASMPMTLKVMALGAEDDGGGIDASLFAFKPPSLSGECASRVCGEGAIRCEELTAEGDEFAGLVFRPVCRHDLFCRTRSGSRY